MTLITKDPKLAASALKEGKVVALPTETVYGLAASIYQEKALEEIFHLKKRASDNPLIVHALDLEMIETFAKVTDDFLKLYEAFMPGPLTVLLEKKDVSDTVTRGQNTVACRVPSHPLFREVLKELKEPLAAPSANLSGKPSSTEASHVYHDFAPNLEMILDGGSSSHGIESTIIQVYDDHGVVLRPGSISKEELEKVLNKPFFHVKGEIKVVVPGMKYRHYAPKANVILVNDLNKIPTIEKDIMVMAESKIPCEHFEYLTEENLYRAFRKADDLKLRKIYCLISLNLSDALINRLEKSSL